MFPRSRSTFRHSSKFGVSVSVSKEMEIFLTQSFRLVFQTDQKTRIHFSKNQAPVKNFSRSDLSQNLVEKSTQKQSMHLLGRRGTATTNCPMTTTAHLILETIYWSKGYRKMSPLM